MKPIERQAPREEIAVTREDLRTLERVFGGQFISPPSIERKSLKINVSSNNPEGEIGGYGTFDYERRIVYVDIEVIRAAGRFSEQAVKMHELLHILERDLIGTAPVHSHLTHILFDGLAEQNRIIGMSKGIAEEPIKTFLFPADPDKEISFDDEKLEDTIVLVENAMRSKLAMRGATSNDYERMMIALAAMDLQGLKTVFFARKLDSAPIAIAFETACKNLSPEHILIGDIKAYRFDEECVLLEEVIQRQREKERESVRK